VCHTLSGPVPTSTRSRGCCAGRQTASATLMITVSEGVRVGGWGGGRGEGMCVQHKWACHATVVLCRGLGAGGGGAV
jgi:hypothetical protein